METTTIVENQELALITANSGLEKVTTDAIAKKFNQFFTTAKEWKQKIEGLQITSVEQKAEMKMARDARLFLKNTRIIAEKEKDAMRAVIKERMSKDVSEDKLVVECFKLVETAFKNIEKIAQDKEDYAEKLEQERKDKLKAERIQILTPLSEFVPMGLNLADMSEDDFSKLVNGANLQKEAKVQADKKLQEENELKEQKVKLYQQRKEMLLPYWSFLKGDQSSADFSELPQESFDILLREVIAAKEANDLEKENQRLEIERLKAENEAKEKRLIAEKESLKLKADNRVDFLMKNGYYCRAKDCFSKQATDKSIPFDVTYNLLLSLTDDEFTNRFNEVEELIKQEMQKEAELAELNRIAKEKSDKQAAIIEQQKLELKAKQDAEEKAKQEEEAKLEAELNKGDAAKFNDLIADLTLITTKYSFKSKKNQKIYGDIVILVNKTIAHANEKKVQ
jgi:hypothetical protein